MTYNPSKTANRSSGYIQRGGIRVRVTVKLFATFRDGRFKVEERDLPEGSRVLDVLQSLNITPEEVAICLVNGRDVNEQHVIKNGDTIALFPPVGGG